MMQRRSPGLQQLATQQNGSAGQPWASISAAVPAAQPTRSSRLPSAPKRKTCSSKATLLSRNPIELEGENDYTFDLAPVFTALVVREPGGTTCGCGQQRDCAVELVGLAPPPSI